MPGRLTEAQPPDPPQSRGARESPTASADEPGRSPELVEAGSSGGPPRSNDAVESSGPGFARRRLFPPEETLAVLLDLDRLALELHGSPTGGPPPERPPSGAAARAPGPSESPKVTPERSNRPDGIPSPYLDERLATARRASALLQRELHQMESRSKELREAIDTIDRELARAGEELTHLRSTEWEADDPGAAGDTLGRRGRPPGGGFPTEAGSWAPVRPAGPRGPPGATVPAFEAFTVDRYNRTVGGLRGRWSRTAAAVGVAAALISLALELLLLRYWEPLPAWWIAVLPSVWMIPVPFFVVSFRATHRMIRRSPFELPAAP